MKEVMNNQSNQVYVAVGRRKTSVARVRIRAGKGEFMVNKKSLEDYFYGSRYCDLTKEVLEVTDSAKSFDIFVNVRGGGYTGQSGAIKHGLARALLLVDESNRKVLKKNGFLTRDPRMVERKKYGRKGARKRFQFSKR